MSAPDLVTFLEQFRPDGYTTYVAILPDGDTIAETFNGTDPGHAERWIRKQNRDHRGIHYTVNATPAGLRRKPAKADIISIDGVWSDVDPLDGNGRSWNAERERLEALADELHTLPWPPTFIIDSGNGIQPVWQLADPIDASEEYRQAAESLCSQIEASLGAKGTHNVDRLLRVPGTINHPNAKKRALGRARPNLACCVGPGAGTAGPNSSSLPSTFGAIHCAMPSPASRRGRARPLAMLRCRAAHQRRSRPNV
jgi:hypothetical protein